MKSLSTASPMECFWVYNGPIVCNILELHKALIEDISDEQFFHHVTTEKNDFANWIYVTLRDKSCGLKAKEAHSRHQLAKILKATIDAYGE